MTTDIRLNDQLDVALIRETYERFGRIHVPDVLASASADFLYATMKDKVPWQTHFNEGEKSYDLHDKQLEALSESDRARLMQKLTANASTKFQYIFRNYPISDAIEQHNNPDQPVHAFHDFINSAAVLDFIRTISGIEDIRFADCQATLYQPGHFLTIHNDDVDRAGRLVAYVFSFTPNWRPDFGGMLLFLDEDGHVEEGYMPDHNSLNLFTIPKKHCVSYVAPFAVGGRYSISGWFRK
jgi:SM-20-related protein